MSRRAPRRNPRPIPLDRQAIAALVERLYAKLRGRVLEAADGPTNASTRPRVLVQDEIDLKAVDGSMLRVLVLLTAAAGEVGAVNGGAKGARDDQPVVIVEMNGRYPLRSLADPAATAAQVSRVLAHELSHAADVFASASGPQRVASEGVPDEGELDLAAYYNHPGEVRAHMRELAEELRPHVEAIMRSRLGAEWGVGGAVRRLVAGSQTWQDMAPHLTARNRNRILAGLVRELAATSG